MKNSVTDELWPNLLTHKSPNFVFVALTSGLLAKLGGKELAHCRFVYGQLDLNRTVHSVAFKNK